MAYHMQGVPVTQIVQVDINPEIHLSKDPTWLEIIDVVEKSNGFERAYWGRSHEHPLYVQLHIVRKTMAQHQQFVFSDEHAKFLALMKKLTGSAGVRSVRHAQLKSWTPNNPSLTPAAPFTGTAIYLKATAAFQEGSWPLWTHIVRHVDGCMGCTGGPLLEPVETARGALDALVNGGEEERETIENGYLVYVGWQTTRQHNHYHHTQHFSDHRIVLDTGCDGFAEYGHIVFEGTREKRERRADSHL